jgi:hypothetical protein
MSSTNIGILPPRATPTPARGTQGALANTFYAKGTMVGRDANGRAYSYASADASANPLMGVCSASYDNRTNSEAGGLNDSIDIDVEYGVVGYAFTGTTPKVGDRLYVVDNQTVSTSDNGGLRGFAGICTEVQTISGTSRAFFQIGPINVLSSSTAGAPSLPIGVPVLTALLGSTGGPLAVYADSANNPSVPGIQLTDSEVGSVRWNNAATFTSIMTTVYVPAPSDPAAPAVLHLLVSKTGATVGDAVTFTVGAFTVAVGDLHDADADFGGTSSAITGNATSKTVQEVTLTLTGANLADTAALLTLTIKPTDGTMGTDDISLHSAFITR